MCIQLENLAKNFNLLVLPSTLWGVHIDPKYDFIAIIHLDATNINNFCINKGILLTYEGNYIKSSVSINNELIEIPSISPKISAISDLSLLLYTLDDIKLCFNATKLSDCQKCTKYVMNSTSNYCCACIPEENILNGFSKPEDYYTNPQTIDYQPVLNKLNSDISNELNLFTQNCEPLPKPVPINMCNVCGIHFNSSSNLDEHMPTHSATKPFECRVCRKSFAKKYNLNVHLRVHSGERPYVCSKCGKTYTTRSNLSTHMMSVHCKEKRHPCEVCGLTFVHPRVLKIHMRIHTGEKPFMCQICGKVFSKNIHLTVHTRTHTGEKPHICTVCGKRFTTTGNLNSHKKINHKDVIS